MRHLPSCTRLASALLFVPLYSLILVPAALAAPGDTQRIERLLAAPTH